MKVIGIIDDENYICQVSHKELEKFLNKYFGNLNTLKVGSEIDLSTGYDHLKDIETALNRTKEFIQSNQTTVNAIINGLSITKVKR